MDNDGLHEELESHLELQARKHMAAGMNEAEARRRARIEFGGLDLVTEQCRDVDPWRRLEAARRNLKHSLRSAARSPLFSLIAIVILGLSAGATVAAFNLMDALLFRPLPLPQPDELMRIASRDTNGRLGQLPSTFIEALRDSTWLGGACGFNTSYESAEANGTLSPIGILGFTGDCFRTLGLATQRGRALIPSDDDSGAAGAAVITGRLWRKAYGGRNDVIGQRIQMPGATFIIVGIAEDRFTGLLTGFPADLIVPLHQEPSQVPGRKQEWWWVNVIGRRAAGVSESGAAAALAAQSSWLLERSLPPRPARQGGGNISPGSLRLCRPRPEWITSCATVSARRWPRLSRFVWRCWLSAASTSPA